MCKCIVGIAGNLIRDDQGVYRDFISREYIRCLEKAGAGVLILPVQEEIPEQIFAVCDGFLLPGGWDVEPSFYGQEKDPRVKETLGELDEFQLRLARAVLEQRKPLLATCRGCQILNVAMGGTLLQHIDGHEQTGERGGMAHRISVEKGSALHRMLGDGCEINSFHHQVIEQTAPGLTVSARAEDGAIEAVEICGYPYGIGVQWHPEVTYAKSEEMKEIFETFVAACESRM